LYFISSLLLEEDVTIILDVKVVVELLHSHANSLLHALLAQHLLLLSGVELYTCTSSTIQNLEEVSARTTLDRSLRNGTLLNTCHSTTQGNLR
jgi:hypothetical protein